MEVQSVAGAIVEAWAERGVGLAVGLDDPQAIFHSLRTSSIRTVIVHDERSGAFMADGYSRASGRPSVCSGVTGPGATNLATGLLEAYETHTPVIGLVGESLGTDLRPAFQETPHGAVLGPLTKGIVEAERDPEWPGAAARYAVDLATSGPSRPVLFLADANRLWEPVEGDGEPPAGAAPGPPAADVEALTEVANLLAEAQRPVILAGNGVHLSGAYAELAAVAESYRVPVATSLLGKGAIDEMHPLALGVASSYNGGELGHGRHVNQALAEADVLLVVGSSLDPITTSGGRWPESTTHLARIDLDERALLARGGLAVRADAAAALRQLAELCSSDMPSRLWVDGRMAEAEQERTRLEEYDAGLDQDANIAPARLVRELDRRLSEGDTIVTDASYCSAWALDRVRQRWAGRYVLAPRGSGVLGWGLPASLGVQIARPENRVVCLTGDGGLLFSLAEFETATREQLPVAVCLLNNQSYGFQRHSDLKRTGCDNSDLMIGPIDWSGLATATGWRYVAIDGDEDLASQLDAALTWDGPVLIDVAVDNGVKPPITMFDEEAAVAH